MLMNKGIKMKKSLIFLILFSVIFSLVSCSAKEYKDGIKVSYLTDKIKTALPLPDGYGEHGGDYLLYRFDDIDEHIDGYSIIYSKDSSLVDLIAVFHAKSERDVRDVEDACKDFLEDQKALFSSLVEQYRPDEKSKLDGAEMRTFGRYVAVCVLDKNARDKAFSIIKSELEK